MLGICINTVKALQTYLVVDTCFLCSSSEMLELFELPSA